MLGKIFKIRCNIPDTEVLKKGGMQSVHTLLKLEVFGVGVSCRKLYSFVVYLYVDGSGSITSVGGRES